MTEEFIKMIKKLIELEVDISKMRAVDTIESLALKSGIERIEIEKVGLKPYYNIGTTKNTIAVAYRKEKSGEKPSHIPPTQKNVEDLLLLGISLERKRCIKSKTIGKVTCDTTIGACDKAQIDLKRKTEKLNSKRGAETYYVTNEL